MEDAIVAAKLRLTAGKRLSEWTISRIVERADFWLGVCQVLQNAKIFLIDAVLVIFELE